MFAIRILLNAWRRRIFNIRCTLLRDTPVIRAVWRWLSWVPGLSSCDWQSCSTSARFSSVIAVTGLPLRFLRSILPIWRYFARTRLMLRWFHFLFGNSFAIQVPVHCFSVKHATITAKSSFEENHCNQTNKYVIYIIRFLPRLTS